MPSKTSSIKKPVQVTPIKQPQLNEAKVKQMKKKKHYDNYSIYIFRLLRTIHPQIGISKKGMEVMNSFVVDVFERLALEASKLVRYFKKGTLSSREMQTAVRLILPGELSKHALTEGTKAITKFVNH